MTRPLSVAVVFAVFCAFLLTFAMPLSANQGKAKGHAKHAVKREQKEDKKEEKAASKTETSTSRSGMRFQDMDRDHNGVVTRAEWRGNDASFLNHDWNHDGVLSGDELRPGAVRPAVRPPASSRSTAAATAPTRRGSGPDPDGPVFERLDTNHDGVLTRAEWPDPRFSSVDFNHDGVLSPYEYGVGR
jgi:EF hand domain-containing protein